MQLFCNVFCNNARDIYTLINEQQSSRKNAKEGDEVVGERGERKNELATASAAKNQQAKLIT